MYYLQNVIKEINCYIVYGNYNAYLWMRNMDNDGCNKQKLRTFENKMWWNICGTVFNADMKIWRRRYNGELKYMVDIEPVTSFIKVQRIQQLDHILKREENDPLRVIVEWKPRGNRPRGRSKKYMDI